MLRNEVMTAFSKVPHPGDDGLTACACDECRWEVGRLKGKRWSRLSLDDFATGDGGANVAILTPPAFHYFLPGLILLALDHPDMRGEMLGKVVNRLTVSDRAGEATRNTVEQVVKRLSGRQRQVLVDLIRQEEGSVPHVPLIWRSAIANLIDGVASPYAADAVNRYLAETFGGVSGYPSASEGRND